MPDKEDESTDWPTNGLHRRHSAYTRLLIDDITSLKSRLRDQGDDLGVGALARLCCEYDLAMTALERQYADA